MGGGNYDRNFSFFGANLWTGTNDNPYAIKTDLVLSYRKTNMFGLGFSNVQQNFALGADFAYFITDDNIDNENFTLYASQQISLTVSSAIENQIEQILERNKLKQSGIDLQILEDAATTINITTKIIGEDGESIKSKTEALVQSSLKLGEAIYKQNSKGTAPQPDPSGEEPSSDNKDEKVVDADFEEVDENKKD